MKGLPSPGQMAIVISDDEELDLGPDVMVIRSDQVEILGDGQTAGSKLVRVHLGGGMFLEGDAVIEKDS
jgi:hypothetical protein